MYFFYNLILILLSPIILLTYLARVFLTGKEKEGYLQRLGFLPKEFYKLEDKNYIWIHAVSVGEVMAAKPVIKECKIIFPDYNILLSTITDTGNKVAKTIKEVDFVFYLPLDYKFLIKKIFNKKNISALIIMETEIWPNLVALAKQNKVKTILINGRFSSKSFKVYKKFKFFFKDVLKNFDLFLMQSEESAKRIKSLGANNSQVFCTGNTKFDIAISFTNEATDKLKKEIGLNENQIVIVAGSTHPGEEEIILNIFEKLKSSYKNLFLIVVPRHPERSADIVKELNFRKLKFALRKNNNHNEKNGQEVFLVNTIGELVLFFTVADLVILGGSFVPIGGHNILEPLSLGKVTLFGPYMDNFKAILKDIKKHNVKAVIDLRNKDELYVKLKEILKQQNFKEELFILGKQAQQIISKNKGASKESVLKLKKLLKNNETL